MRSIQNGLIWNVAGTCIDYWQPEVQGPGLCSEGVLGRMVIWRVSKVLQVTVQVKRQILSAVRRKALEVPTVQKERSSLPGIQARVLSVETGWLLCSVHMNTVQQRPPEDTEQYTKRSRFKTGVGTIQLPFPVRGASLALLMLLCLNGWTHNNKFTRWHYGQIHVFSGMFSMKAVCTADVRCQICWFI